MEVNAETLEVCLVNVPFAQMNLPSMALSLLQACLAGQHIRSRVFYENLRFAQLIGLKPYQMLAYESPLYSRGEVVFSLAAHNAVRRGVPAYARWLEHILQLMQRNPGIEENVEERIREVREMQEAAKQFIPESAERILAVQPKIVAISSMFQQTNAAIALARELKRRCPSVIIMIGGANCMGSAGEALLEYVPEFDYVFFGEADEIFAQVCQRVLQGGFSCKEELPYGVAARQFGKPGILMYRQTKDMDALPYPDFTDFFAMYREVAVPGEVPTAQLMVEGSRGCWWGERKPCTFCGLHGDSRVYRQKSTQRLAREIFYLETKYPDIYGCFFTDSILSRTHMKELPEALLAQPRPLRFFAEIKSNLDEEEIIRLKAAGFDNLQPGIESLQDDVLRIMNKGCRAIKQIEALKHARCHGISFIWNMLCGFPGEKPEYCGEMMQWLPKLGHLTPPNGFVHIYYQKYGEYTEHPAQYGLKIVPCESYDFAYPDQPDFVRKIAYNFEPADPGELERYYDCRAMGEPYALLMEQVRKWRNSRLSPERLDMMDQGGHIEIYDMRKCARHLVHRLEGIQADIYRACRSARKKDALYRQLQEQYTAADIAAALQHLCEENLLLDIRGEYLALAIGAPAKR